MVRTGKFSAILKWRIWIVKSDDFFPLLYYVGGRNKLCISNLPDSSLVYSVDCLIATSVSQPAIIALLIVYNSKILNCIEALSFLRSVHTFSWFLSSNWSSDFGHAETGNGEKKRVALRQEFFCSNFKVKWENGVWTKTRFLASGFCSHAAISLWFLLFFYCLDRNVSKWLFKSIHSSF